MVEFKQMPPSILGIGTVKNSQHILILWSFRLSFLLKGGLKNFSFKVFLHNDSGGALLDSKGNLIGINTAIFTQTGSFHLSLLCSHVSLLLFLLLKNFPPFYVAGTSAGVGFAIPASTVLKIVPQLIQFGKVSMLWTIHFDLHCSLYYSFFSLIQTCELHDPLRIWKFFLIYLRFKSIRLFELVWMWRLLQTWLQINSMFDMELLFFRYPFGVFGFSYQLMLPLFNCSIISLIY